MNILGPLGIGPYIHKVSHATIVKTVTGFGGQVRTDDYDRGNRFSCARVQVAIRIIGQTYEMGHEHNPLYRAPERYSRKIEMMFTGFQRDNLMPVSEIFIPIVVPQQYTNVGSLLVVSEMDKTVSDLTLISFFYILQVGDYT